MRLLLIICLLAACLPSMGQVRLFSPEKKPIQKVAVQNQGRARAIGISPDSVIVTIPGKNSTLNVVRITVVGGYIYSGANSYAAAGIGLALQHQQYDSVNLRYQSKYSGGLYAIGATNGVPKNATDVGSLAGLFGFKNDLLRVGPVYHVLHPVGVNPWGIMFVIGGNFNN